MNPRRRDDSAPSGRPRRPARPSKTRAGGARGPKGRRPRGGEGAPGPSSSPSRKSRRERLHKYIANCGYASRRRAELLIEAGLVRVNGKVESQVGVTIRPGSDVVTIHGERVEPPRPLTIALNKPAGFITSTHDTHDRLTVMDLIPRRLVLAGLLPAGRLDLETEGLLVLTNDGDLLHRVTHPRYECRKEYRALLDRALTPRDRQKLEKGVYLEALGKTTAPARLDRVQAKPNGQCSVHVVLHEGMKRQVRRMFEAVGIRVLHLERLSIGAVFLEDLKRGEWRELDRDERASLRGEGGTVDEPDSPPSKRGGEVRGGSAQKKGPKTGTSRPPRSSSPAGKSRRSPPSRPRRQR